MRKIFEVKSGLFKETAHGCFDEDAPFEWVFETEEAARAWYAELSPADDLDRERANRFCKWAGAFKEIVVWAVDADGEAYDGETIEREELR